MLALGDSRPKLVLFLLLLFPFQTPAEIRSWRVGDQDHPWNLVPVSGRLTWGRGWAVEVLTDDDGDGLIDEDPIELVDSDGDGLFNEDPPDPQLDSDGDGKLNEDPPNKLDDDGDGLIDEDPVEAFDSDLDGRIDEDGPDPQFDSDGDGKLNEDGLMTDGDDDYDGRTNEDPSNGADDDGDGLIDEDGRRLRDTDGVATWLRPIKLNERRNLAILLNERYLQGEFGGVGPDGKLLNPFLEIPSEFGPRVERADSTGLFSLSDDGVQPRLVATVANAARDAGQFSYVDAVRTNGETVQGGATAASNDRIAARLIDGDLDTFWEPAAADFSAAGLRNWELLVDLGRLAFIDSITVSFPAGDAPKAFSLFVSLGEPFPFPDGNNLNFSLVAETKATDLAPPGADGLVRQSYPIAPLLRADFNLDGQPDLRGSFLQYIRMKITESDLARHRFVGAGDAGRDAYQALPPERRGAVVHQRLTAGSFLIEIDEDTYFNDVSTAQRGPIRYFEREVPRVAEVEVWTKGDNLALNPRERAGDSYEIGGRGTPNQATDGLYQTEWTAWGYDPTIVRGTMWLDLGATFWVDGIYAVMRRQRSGSAFAGHGFLVSDGTQLKPVQLYTAEDFVQLEEALQWHDIISAARFDNRQPQVLMFGEEFAPRKIRFVQVRNLLSPGSGARLAEMQLYGSGYPVDVSLHSPPIRLTNAGGNFIRKTLPRIAWSADAVIRDEDPLTGQVVERIEPLDQHPEVRLDIQTRTSDYTDTNFTYYQVVTVAGNEEREEVSKEAYDEIALQWTAWEIWQTLPASQKHASRTDDDGDGDTDEDPIDLIDNDGDGKIDEDGRKLRRAPRSSFAKDGELAFVGWSEWSENYQPTDGRSEATITSPSPRKFVQIRFHISSEDPFKTARIRSFHIDLAPPLALELAGELALLSPQGTARPIGDLDAEPMDYSPPQDINPLTPQHFSYFARLAAPDPDDPTVRDGVDEILIVAPQAAEPLGVRLGWVEVERQVSDLDSVAFSTRVLKTHFDQVFALGPDGRLQDADGQTIAILPTGPDSLYLRFPASLNADLSPDTHALVEVQFASQTFREGVLFPAFARSSTDPTGFFQRVDAEAQDATELVASGTARVSLQAVGRRLINDVQVARVFTPNGDGANDLLQGRFVLLRILAERRLDIAFYDLAGARRGRAGSDLGQAGQWNFAWDGRDEHGQLVPPGIYLCRIKIAADRGAEEEIFPVHVAY